MAQISLIAGSSRVVMSDFVRGTRVIHTTPSRRVTECDIMAHALWLERHGRKDEACEYLEKACGQLH